MLQIFLLALENVDPYYSILNSIKFSLFRHQKKLKLQMDLMPSHLMLLQNVKLEMLEV